MKLLCSIFYIAIVSVSSTAQETDPVTVLTGGYEAITARRVGTPLDGPRTDAVKTYMDQVGIPYKIEATLWARALNLTLKEPRTLIYPLTRTPEREDQFDWIKEIDTHTYHLIAAKALVQKNLSKEEIISGKYLAICESTTAHCQILKNFGFPDEAIVKVKGRITEEVINLLVNGRVSFFMDDIEHMRDNTDPELFKQIDLVRDYSVTYSEYLAGYKTDPGLVQRLHIQD